MKNNNVHELHYGWRGIIMKTMMRAEVVLVVLIVVVVGIKTKMTEA